MVQTATPPTSTIRSTVRPSRAFLVGVVLRVTGVSAISNPRENSQGLELRMGSFYAVRRSSAWENPAVRRRTIVDRLRLPKQPQGAERMAKKSAIVTVLRDLLEANRQTHPPTSLLTVRLLAPSIRGLRLDAFGGLS